ncbi:MAG: hypothetical protein HC788_11320 [Sphingopyxis sp.]|nr:hypothetical protein [Sphingopyxis sp.]
MSGIRRFASILALCWVLSWLTIDGRINDAISPPAATILLWVEALPLALIVSLLVWLSIRFKPAAKSLYLTPALFWGAISIGALKWGSVYQRLKETGFDGSDAVSQALLGSQGIIIGAGILGLIYSKTINTRETNAPNK